GLETFRGMFDPSVWSDPPIVQWVRFPLFLLALLLLVLGLEILLIRRQYLIPLTLAGCILLLPFLAAYRVQLSRYWMLALSPLTLAIATGVVAAVQWTKGRVRLLSACLACSLILMLSTYSLPGLWQMYEARAQVRPTNAEMERLAGLVQVTMRLGDTVLIDIKIFEKRTADETGEPWTLGHLLTFRRVPVMYAVHESGQLGAILEQDPDRSYLLVAPLFSSATLPTDIATL